MTRFLRFTDLVERKIVKNRMTLKRWIDSREFPKPVKLGPNTAAWLEHEVEAWLSDRANERSAKF